MNDGLEIKSNRKPLPSYWKVLWRGLIFGVVIILAGPGYLTAGLVAPLNKARYLHTASLLSDGRVLVAGGQGQTGAALVQTEIYDPVAESWTNVVNLKTPRYLHTATLLSDGRVLVTGGYNGASLDSTEIYNPADGTWTPAAALKSSRRNHTATLLPDGRVLVAGGYNELSPYFPAAAEVYDPGANTWSPVATLKTPRDEHTSTLLPDGRVMLTGGTYSGYLDKAEIYDPGGDTWAIVANLSQARERHTATLLPDGRILVAGGYNGTVQLGSAEVYNSSSNSWVALINQHMARERHTATLMPNGWVLIIGGYNVNNGSLASVDIYDPVANGWRSLTSLNTARDRHTATLLPSGEVLLAGGYSFGTVLDSAEIYNLADNLLFSQFFDNASSLTVARSGHTATLLPDGRVLAAGGYNGVYLTDAEIYDSTVDAWTHTGAMNSARNDHTATLLPDGRVLVAGGYMGGSLGSAEIYNPAADIWTPAGALNTARRNHTASLLPDGRVLVAGGHNGAYLDSAEIYNPVTNAWTPVAHLNTARRNHTATLLPDGRVLATGGNSGDSAASILASAEIYNAAANTWTSAADLNTARTTHTTTLLPDGRVLAAGGQGAAGYLDSAEIYNSAANIWSFAAALSESRYGHTATLLPGGKVLAAGGANSGLDINAEIYNPAVNTWTTVLFSSISRLYHTATLLPDGRVLVTGGGIGTFLASARAFDRGLGYQSQWRPTVNSIPLTLPLGGTLTLTGAGFRGYGFTEASGGGTNNSATNYPIVQILRLGNEQLIRLDPGAAFGPTSFTSKPFNNILPGPALVTVWVNAIPSLSRYIHLTYETAITLSTSQNTVNYGNPVTFTATVSSSGGTPTGTVRFRVDGVDFGDPVPLAGGVAQAGNVSLPAGTYQVTAHYKGDLNFNDADTALPLNQMVTPAATAVALTTSQGSVPYGTLVTFTAAVTSSGGIPTGTVQFQVDGVDYGDPVSLVEGLAGISSASLSTGQHNITAVYQGDLNFMGGATTSPLIQQINPKLFLPLILK